MEGLIYLALLVVGLTLLFARKSTPKRRPKSGARGHTRKPATRPKPKPLPPFDAKSARPQAGRLTLEGHARIVDGDTIVIRKTQIRLFGVDAPEINHPFGQKAKWALVALCKGKHVRAEIMETDAHGRTVAKCFLPNGSDLSALMVKQGLAIDWPKFSGGIYGPMEVDGVRKKLWLADARQKGRMHVWQQFEARQNSDSKRTE